MRLSVAKEIHAVIPAQAGIHFDFAVACIRPHQKQDQDVSQPSLG
jgi:hypothetical protein